MVVPGGGRNRPAGCRSPGSDLRGRHALGARLGLRPGHGNPVACENHAARHAAVRVGHRARARARPSRDSPTRSASTSGSTIKFKIESPATSYTIDIYRMGYYGGDGARLIASVTPNISVSQNQPACNTNTATGLVDCGNWGVSASWTVPTDRRVRRLLRAHLPHRRHQRREPDPVRGAQRRQPLGHHLQDLRRDLAGLQRLGRLQPVLGHGHRQRRTAPLDPGRAVQVSYNRPFATRFDTPTDRTSSSTPSTR